MCVCVYACARGCVSVSADERGCICDHMCMIVRAYISVSVRVNESVCVCCGWIGSADVPLKTTKPSQTLQSQRDGRQLLASEICVAKRWQAKSSDKQGWKIGS